MTREQFHRLVTEAMQLIPRRFREAMDNVSVVVEDEPNQETLAELGIKPPDTLYGLYQGTPLPERGWDHGNVLPDLITIYQQPIVRDNTDRGEVVRAIGETIIHEFGHYFGLSEDEIEAVETRYWRDDQLDEGNQP